jgi:hypothetical protein
VVGRQALSIFFLSVFTPASCLEAAGNSFFMLALLYRRRALHLCAVLQLSNSQLGMFIISNRRQLGQGMRNSLGRYSNV